MSLIGRRLQIAEGASANKLGYGRQLPQGGFQSIDAKYTAEDRCKILPPGTQSDFGEGTQDVVDPLDNGFEDDVTDDNGEEKVVPTDDIDEDTKKQPQLQGMGHLELPTDFEQED